MVGTGTPSTNEMTGSAKAWKEGWPVSGWVGKRDSIRFCVRTGVVSTYLHQKKAWREIRVREREGVRRVV